MSLADFGRMVAVCFVWALNNVLGVILIAEMSVPPLFYATLRLPLVTALLWPFLRPVPATAGRVVAACLCLGALHFGFLFTGFQTATASTAGVVLQTSIPMAAVLSVLFLGERLGPRRIVGIVLALTGVVIVMWRPDEMALSFGLVLVLLSAAALSVGSILVKTVPDMRPLRLQAWVNAASLPFIALASFALEQDAVGQADASPYFLAGCVVFSALVMTIYAHTSYFRLLQTRTS